MWVPTGWWAENRGLGGHRGLPHLRLLWPFPVLLVKCQPQVLTGRDFRRLRISGGDVRQTLCKPVGCGSGGRCTPHI